VPVADQLVEALSALILTGRQAAGARLPSVRLMARRAGVSPFTVTAAFERLPARGLIESRRGCGHFVALNPRAPSMQEVELGPPPRADAAARFTHSSLNARNVVVAAGSGERLHSSRITVAARNIIVTAGASQAFDLIARRLLSPGETVLVEDPGYFVLPTQLEAHGLKIVPVCRGADGPDLVRLEEVARLHRPVPAFQRGLRGRSDHDRIPRRSLSDRHVSVSYGSVGRVATHAAPVRCRR